jgi:hypothetical protein
MREAQSQWEEAKRNQQTLDEGFTPALPSGKGQFGVPGQVATFHLRLQLLIRSGKLTGVVLGERGSVTGSWSVSVTAPTPLQLTFQHALDLANSLGNSDSNVILEITAKQPRDVNMT